MGTTHHSNATYHLSTGNHHFVLIDHVVPCTSLELVIEPRIGFEVQNPQAWGSHCLSEASKQRIEECWLTSSRRDPQLQNRERLAVDDTIGD
jgi:hypothetical protein